MCGIGEGEPVGEERESLGNCVKILFAPLKPITPFMRILQWCVEGAQDVTTYKEEKEEGDYTCLLLCGKGKELLLWHRKRRRLSIVAMIFQRNMIANLKGGK